jgi:hypothetical protein
MRTVVRFERALGRRLGWGFDDPPLKVAPHAFEEANAYYAPAERALLFGYFPGSERWNYTSLSHDIIVHETTHALLDCIRNRYLDLAHPDQAGFHEGFADAIALLSSLTMTDVVQRALLSLDQHLDPDRRLLDCAALTVESAGPSFLVGLANQVGEAFSGMRGQPLRRSVDLMRRTIAPSDPAFDEPHRRGELLVAGMLCTFLAAWFGRLRETGTGERPVEVGHATHEASEVAEALLDVAIKALDYAPPIDLRFGDYLSALLTSDSELRPDDSKYQFRTHALHWHGQFGIEPSGSEEGGLWSRPQGDVLRYDDSQVDSIQPSPEEVLRFLWRNRRGLKLEEDACTQVTSVRTSLRIGSDSFAVRETVIEYKQSLHTTPAECRTRLDLPGRIASETMLKLSGGGLLIFDQNGRLKYHVHQRLFANQQAERLRMLWDLGLLDQEGRTVPLSIAALHARRSAMTRGGR